MKVRGLQGFAKRDEVLPGRLLQTAAGVCNVHNQVTSTGDAGDIGGNYYGARDSELSRVTQPVCDDLRQAFRVHEPGQ